MTHERYGFLANGDELYGVGTVLLNACKGLLKTNKSPIVFVLQEGPLVDLLEKSGIKVVNLNLTHAPRLSNNLFSGLKSLIQMKIWTNRSCKVLSSYLAKEAIECLIFQWPNHVTLGGKSAKSAGAKSFWMMPNILRATTLGINRALYKSACDRYGITPLPNSRYTADTLDPNPQGIASQVLYLGIDSNYRFNPKVVRDVSRESLNIPEGVILFGIFSMITSRKGQHFFLKALQQTEGAQEAHLLLVGASEDEFVRHIKQLAENYGCSDRVHFTGWTDMPEQYYSAIDVAVNSRIDPEPFGLSVIEAMAMQKPVLVHALGGPAETVIDGVTGWHTHDPTVEGFSQGIERCLSDRQRWEEMGIAARQHVLENFSLEAFTQNFIKVTN